MMMLYISSYVKWTAFSYYENRIQRHIGGLNDMIVFLFNITNHRPLCDIRAVWLFCCSGTLPDPKQNVQVSLNDTWGGVHQGRFIFLANSASISWKTVEHGNTIKTGLYLSSAQHLQNVFLLVHPYGSSTCSSCLRRNAGVMRRKIQLIQRLQRVQFCFVLKSNSISLMFVDFYLFKTVAQAVAASCGGRNTDVSS